MQYARLGKTHPYPPVRSPTHVYIPTVRTPQRAPYPTPALDAVRPAIARPEPVPTPVIVDGSVEVSRLTPEAPAHHQAHASASGTDFASPSVVEDTDGISMRRLEYPTASASGTISADAMNTGLRGLLPLRPQATFTQVSPLRAQCLGMERRLQALEAEQAATTYDANMPGPSENELKLHADIQALNQQFVALTHQLGPAIDQRIHATIIPALQTSAGIAAMASASGSAPPAQQGPPPPPATRAGGPNRRPHGHGRTALGVRPPFAQSTKSQTPVLRWEY